MGERIDLTRYLIKLTDKEAQKFAMADDKLPDYIWESEDGDLYRAPGIGATLLYSFPEEPDYKFRYNWRTNEVEAFEKRETEDGEKMNYHDSQPLSLYDFLHVNSLEYWYKVYLEDLLNI